MPSQAIRLEIDAARSTFRFNEIGYRELIAGPVTGDLVRRAIRVEGQAKVNASHPPPSVPGSGPAVRTGRLRGSITWRLGHDFEGPYVDIGTSVFYAPFVEEKYDRPFLRPALSAARIP